MQELKDCPFCGAKAAEFIQHFNGQSVPCVVHSPRGTGNRMHLVVCNHCSCEGPCSSSKEAAIELWNTRK